MGREDGPVPDREHVPTVLVVEDELLIRMSLIDFLEECGFQVLDATNAVEALAMIEAGTVKIDLVFSDIRMPGHIDGFGLAKWIRENRPDLPIVLASADRTKAEVATELCAQQKFFSKPYDAAEVAAHIREVIASHKSEH
jgi:CheY-like chemotaxis protein